MEPGGDKPLLDSTHKGQLALLAIWMGVLLLAALCGALVWWNLTTGRPPQLGPPLLVLTAGVLLLETFAVPLRGFGCYCSSTALYLAAAIQPAVGGMGAMALAVGGVTLRSLLRWEAGFGLVFREAVWELFPTLTAISAAAWTRLELAGTPYELPVAALAAPAVYVLAISFTPRWLTGLKTRDYDAWRQVNRTVTFLRVSCAVGGAGLALLLGVEPWLVLLLYPILLATHRAAENAIFRLAAEEAWDEVTEVTRRLEATVGERDVLEDLTRELTSSQSVEQLLERMVVLADRLASSRSVVVFTPQDGTLEPTKFSSPDASRLENAGLLKMREPLADAVWDEGRARISTREHQRPPRLLEAEKVAVALPLGPHGVLYLGRDSDTPFTELQLSNLRFLGERATGALEAVRRHQEQRATLEHHYALQERVELLGNLLEGSRALASTLSAEDLAAELEKLLKATLPQDFGALLTGDPLVRVRSWFVSEAREEDEQALVALARGALESRRPLLFGDIGASRVAPPVAGMRSILAVPVLAEEGPAGAIVLGAVPADSYTREHQDLLFVIATQAAVALANAKLFEDVTESRAQLLHSSKMAAVGQLAAGVAHELNTPLGVVSLSLDSLETALERNKPERAAQKLAMAREAVATAHTIVRKLLAYSRKSSPDSQPVDMVALVRKTVEILSAKLEQDRVEIVYDLGPVPAVLGRPDELQQVLVNLIINACQAMEENGPPRLRLFTTANDGQVLAGVQDWGPGISPEHQSRIFEPFFTTKPVGKGTGLGLSVSQQIVTGHGGKLELASGAGEGTTFTILLPALPEE